MTLVLYPINHDLQKLSYLSIEDKLYQWIILFVYNKQETNDEN